MEGLLSTGHTPSSFYTISNLHVSTEDIPSVGFPRKMLLSLDLAGVSHDITGVVSCCVVLWLHRLMLITL